MKKELSRYNDWDYVNLLVDFFCDGFYDVEIKIKAYILKPLDNFKRTLFINDFLVDYLSRELNQKIDPIEIRCACHSIDDHPDLITKDDYSDSINRIKPKENELRILNIKII